MTATLFVAVFAVVMTGIGWPVIGRLDPHGHLNSGERLGVSFLSGCFSVYYGIFFIAAWRYDSVTMWGLAAVCAGPAQAEKLPDFRRHGPIADPAKDVEPEPAIVYYNESGRQVKIGFVKIHKMSPAEIQAIGDRIVREMGYGGIANIQVIRDKKSGAYIVSEFNPRLWCSHEILLMNGINLPKMWADDYYGQAGDDSKHDEPAQRNSISQRHWYSENQVAGGYERNHLFVGP